ncbi:hypothetical protein Salmi_Mp035 (mitochondrion) [Salvia miltiorrhiza]|uniref:Uncharacterized protein n=1 Tax=Salvia miltiorrhiza TaxID=226208 RepID=V9P597_SALMI|nr:hypothetical protein Salmi_Mp035 [Salvia miltiorrhiza]AGU16568.1 hypothetical protein Salmi_Mp035 [Salvia miltiorrhiza]
MRFRKALGIDPVERLDLIFEVKVLARPIRVARKHMGELCYGNRRQGRVGKAGLWPLDGFELPKGWVPSSPGRPTIRKNSWLLNAGSSPVAANSALLSPLLPEGELP